MNILTNAIEAAKESVNNPLIRIQTEALDSDQVMIQISDNGCGMTEEIRNKIFDPFFTTKPIGSGTGLGMSISYQIIDKHGGTLKCVSAPNEGTEFIIYIPTRLKSSI